MNTQSFNRLVIVQAFARKETKDASGKSSLVDIDKTGTEFRSRLLDGTPGFRIKFQCTKITAATPTPNPATISIWNLGENSRKIVSQLFNLIVIKAGYGESADLLFAGQVKFAKTRKEGSDYVTEITAQDGIHAYQNATINKSFKAGTPLDTVFNTLTGTLAGSGITRGEVIGLPTGSINKGMVLSGNSVKELKNLGETHNLNVSIENAKVQIIPYGSSKGNLAHEITEDTGMIGIPEVRQTDLNNRSLISFKTLLNPKIETFHKCSVKSKFVNGVYTSLKVNQSGDSWGDDFYTDVEAR